MSAMMSRLDHMDTLFLKIEERFTSCKQEDVVYGYTYVYDLIMLRSLPSYGYNKKCDIVMELLYWAINEKAKKYYNLRKETFEIEVNRLVQMCEYIHRYNKTINNQILEYMDYAWLLAEHDARLKLIGTICVQNNLPAGDPPWLAREIGEYVG
jgi:hypothetical protein